MWKSGKAQESICYKTLENAILHITSKEKNETYSSSQLNASSAISYLGVIKKYCKHSAEATEATFRLLFTCLKKSDSTIRSKALDIIDILFRRSSRFRALLSKNIPEFLELTIGHCDDKPLPAPLDVAENLRSKTWAMIQKWNIEHGGMNRQLPLAVKYLKRCFRNGLPEIDQRASQRETEARQWHTRTQNLLASHFLQLRESWTDTSHEIAGLLREFSEAFDLVHEANKRMAVDEDIDWQDMEWETNVTARSRRVPVEDSTLEEEGLTDYSNGNQLFHVSSSNHSCVEQRVQHYSSIEPAILNALIDTYRVISCRALPKLQRALRILSRVEITDDLERERTQMLREATELRARLTSAEQKYNECGIDESFYRKKNNDPGENIEGAAEDHIEVDFKRNPQNSTSEAQNQKAPRYALHDPAAPSQDISSRKPKYSDRKSGKKSLISAELRRTLAAQAPVLPMGLYASVWDTDAEKRVYISNSAMEVSNHWGPVDVHAQLPKERLDDLFLVNVDANTKKTQYSTTKITEGTRKQLLETKNGNTQALETNLERAKRMLLQQNDLRKTGGQPKQKRKELERNYNDLVIGSSNVFYESQTPRSIASTEKKPKTLGNRTSSKKKMTRKLLSGKALSSVREDANDIEHDKWRNKFGVVSWRNT